VLGTQQTLPKTGLGLPLPLALGISLVCLLAGGALLALPGQVQLARIRKH
jgi:hypothetical protein